MGKSVRHSYEYVKEVIESEGYKLLSKEYKGNKIKLDMICPEGHFYQAHFNSFSSIGRRCGKCSYESNIRNKTQKHSYEFVKETLEREGYKLLSNNYKNSHFKIKIQCDKGHVYETPFHYFLNGGNRCPICRPKFSKSEKEIADFIKENGFIINENDRSMIKNPLTNTPLELDILIPELHKAIEFNGRYWHSDKLSIKRDRIKKEQCLINGIDLLVIEEQDWMNNKNKCLKIIKDFLERENMYIETKIEKVIKTC